MSDEAVEPVSSAVHSKRVSDVIQYGDIAELKFRVPEYLSFAHAQNQSKVSEIYVPRYSAVLTGKPSNGELSLKVVLRCQGRDVSQASFITLRDSATQNSLTKVPLQLDADFFLEVREATNAAFEFTLLDDAEEVGSSQLPTLIYPPNLWIYSTHDKWESSALMLTTFVKPRDPKLDQILTRARQIKGTYTDSNGQKMEPTTAGYQGSDETVLAEVRAIYEAVQEQGIQYSNPPGSLDWSNAQLIRTSTEVLEANVATCLDSTVFFAALLESVGIRPLLVLKPGHAFVGFWTRSGAGANVTSAVAPAEEAVQYLSQAIPKVRFVETTMLCQSVNMSSFSDSVIHAERTLLQVLHRSELDAAGQDDWRVIDLRTARAIGFRPMASKVKNTDGTSSIVEYTLEQREAILDIKVEVARLGPKRDDAPDRVRYWKSQLLDLSFNNPLLNMKRRSASQVRLLIPRGKLGSVEDFLQQPSAELRLASGLKITETEKPGQVAIQRILADADGSAPEAMKAELDSLFVDNQTIRFEVRTLSQQKIANEVVRASFNRLRNLSKAAKQSLEETGANNLYMTFGSLRWMRKDASSEKDAYVVSPLILLPITLKPIEKGKFWSISLDDSNDVATNETLALKLSSEYGIEIPALTAPPEDGAGINIPALVESVRQAVIQAKQSKWIVSEDSTLGTYDFSTFHIWKDLNDNWKKLAEPPLVKHLIETDGDEVFIDPNRIEKEVTEEELDAELAKVPVASDGTQLRAVVRSLRGESFIIQGPPGTGKSQTITNLLARNLEAGRKVLFMSEKPAALEVVKNRLDEIKLGHFVLDLHSKNTSAAAIRNQLLAALDANPRIDTEGIESASFDFEVSTKALAKFPERLHRIHPKYKYSVYSVRAKLLALPVTEKLDLARSALSYFDSERLIPFMSQLQDLPEIGQQAGTAAGNAWSLSTLEGEQITQELRLQISSSLRVLIPTVRQAFANPSIRMLLSSLRTFSELVGVANSPRDIPSLSEMRELSEFQYREKLREHKQLLSELKQQAFGVSTGTNFGSAPMTTIWEELKAAAEAKLFKKKKLQAVASQLAQYWKSSLDDSNVLQEVTIAKNLHAFAVTVAESSRGIPCINPIKIEDLFADAAIEKRQEAIVQMESLVAAATATDNSFGTQLVSLQVTDRELLVEAALALLQLAGQLKSDQSSFATWLGSEDLVSRLEKSITKWETEILDGEFRFLIRWGNLLQILKSLDDSEQGAAKAQILSGEIDFVSAPRAFERAYLELLMEKLIDDHELSNFEAGLQSANITKLKKSADSLRVFNRDTIAGAVVKARTFDPTSVAGKAGALRSELNKQKGQMSIRQLMKKYWETITEITPCVAASPDSVARFLDVDLAHFDVVIFDEASQLRVPNSIGALGRGKSAIIVGDSKQMPPSQLFTAGAGDDEDEAVSAQPDVESILTMAEYSKLPSVMLTWHYRSQHESLIAFSNKEYYLGQLSSFPSPREEDKENRAIKWVFVEDGQYIRSSGGAKKAPATAAPDNEFEDEFDEEQIEGQPEEAKVVASKKTNRNPIEAARVVDKVLELYAQLGDRLSLGIVTMNEQQREAIQDLLEVRAGEGLRKLLNKNAGNDYVFVRALEKVQGDERDIILMSVGFSRVPDGKSEKGYVVPQNFGPLTRAGSERRLNVAVTRARQRVIVFSSFDPEDLRITESSALGLVGLRDYLKLAKEGAQAVGLGNRADFVEPDRHRIDVSKAIESLGYETKQDVGLSSFRVDIAVKHPTNKAEFALGVLLDGPSWKSRPTANDRDVLPVGVLQKNMGWGAVERVWLPNWIKDPAGELTRLKSAIENALTAPPRVSEPAIEVLDLPDLDSLLAEATQEMTPTISIPLTTSVGVNIQDVELFTELRPSLVTSDKSELQQTNHPAIKEAIVKLIGNLTAAEGPVHPDRAVNYVAKCFGLSHVQTARAQAILTAIPRARYVRDDDGFVFPDGVSITTFNTWRRADDGVPRDVLMVSLTEIGNAMRDLCDRTHGMQAEELLRQTMLAFGPKTLSAPIRKRLNLALKFAETRKHIILEGDHFVPGI